MPVLGQMVHRKYNMHIIFRLIYWIKRCKIFACMRSSTRSYGTLPSTVKKIKIILYGRTFKVAALSKHLRSWKRESSPNSSTPWKDKYFFRAIGVDAAPTITWHFSRVAYSDVIYLSTNSPMSDLWDESAQIGSGVFCKLARPFARKPPSLSSTTEEVRYILLEGISKI